MHKYGAGTEVSGPDLYFFRRHNDRPKSPGDSKIPGRSKIPTQSWMHRQSSCDDFLVDRIEVFSSWKVLEWAPASHSDRILHPKTPHTNRADYSKIKKKRFKMQRCNNNSRGTGPRVFECLSQLVSRGAWQSLPLQLYVACGAAWVRPSARSVLTGVGDGRGNAKHH